VFVVFGPNVCLQTIVFAFELGINESFSSVQKNILEKRKCYIYRQLGMDYLDRPYQVDNRQGLFDG
jgi:hypothetical protein